MDTETAASEVTETPAAVAPAEPTTRAARLSAMRSRIDAEDDAEEAVEMPPAAASASSPAPTATPDARTEVMSRIEQVSRLERENFAREHATKQRLAELDAKEKALATDRAEADRWKKLSEDPEAMLAAALERLPPEQLAEKLIALSDPTHRASRVAKQAAGDVESKLAARLESIQAKLDERERALAEAQEKEQTRAAVSQAVEAFASDLPSTAALMKKDPDSLIRRADYHARRLQSQFGDRVTLTHVLREVDTELKEGLAQAVALARELGMIEAPPAQLKPGISSTQLKTEPNGLPPRRAGQGAVTLTNQATQERAAIEPKGVSHRERIRRLADRERRSG